MWAKGCQEARTAQTETHLGEARAPPRGVGRSPDAGGPESELICGCLFAEVPGPQVSSDPLFLKFFLPDLY